MGETVAVSVTDVPEICGLVTSVVRVVVVLASVGAGETTDQVEPDTAMSTASYVAVSPFPAADVRRRKT
jgi:hypothetical protein